MKYQFTYSDWKNGDILWNSIVTNTYEPDYISNNCKDRIEREQKKILKADADRYEKSIHQIYVKNYRSSEDVHLIAQRWLETIDNLFSADIESFNETDTINLKDGLTKSVTEEKKVCVIPPIGLSKFNKKTIELIRSAKESYNNTLVWNHNTIQTPIVAKLIPHQDYIAEIYAKAYTDFSKRLRRYDGTPINTFISSYEEFSLRRLRVDLKKSGFINSKIDTDLFVKIFKGYLLLRSERIDWSKSLDSLHYLIDNLELETPDRYGIWQTVSNCFTINGKVIDADNIRKANRCSTLHSELIDSCIKFLKS